MNETNRLERGGPTPENLNRGQTEYLDKITRSDRTGNLILVAARGRLSEDPGRTQSQLWLSRRTSPLKS